jgi:hypothetical protein
VDVPIPGEPDWYCSCLLLRVADGLVPVELRIFPDAGRYPALPDGTVSPTPMGGGEWSRDASDLEPTQLSGIGSRIVRKVPLEEIIDKMIWLQREVEKGFPPRQGWDTEAKRASRRPGRNGRDDRFYAIWARRYVERSEVSRSPTKDLARIHHKPYGAVAQWIHDARERGLLTRAAGGQNGRRGGALTAKALKVLNDER